MIDNVRVEVQKVINDFDSLNGAEKLEVLKRILEQMENGEIKLNDKDIVPKEVGISDGYEIMRNITRLLAKEQ